MQQPLRSFHRNGTLEQSVSDKRIKTILVVDDNSLSLFTCRVFLQEIGYRCLLTKTGREALHIIQENAIDLVLLDYELEDLNGGEVTQLVRTRPLAKTKNTVPVIGISAHTCPCFRQKCLTSGMNDLLSKPFVYNDLVAMIEKYTEEYAKENYATADTFIPPNNQDEDNLIQKSIATKQHKRPVLEPQTATKYVLSDPKHYQGILQHLYDGIDGFYRELVAFYATQDKKHIRRLLHNLRFSCKTVGATELYFLATELEEQIDNSVFSAAKDRLPELQEALYSLKDAIQTQLETFS